MKIFRTKVSTPTDIKEEFEVKQIFTSDFNSKKLNATTKNKIVQIHNAVLKVADCRYANLLRLKRY